MLVSSLEFSNLAQTLTWTGDELIRLSQRLEEFSLHHVHLVTADNNMRVESCLLHDYKC